MTKSTTARGFAVRCTWDGTIESVMRSDLDLLPPECLGRPLSAVFEPDCLIGVLSFLHEIREQGAAYGTELALQAGQEALTVFLGGYRHDDSLVVVAATSSLQVSTLLGELAQLGNKQVNLIRQQAKALSSGPASRANEGFLDDLMKLNNEMAMLQRDLARKNRELAKLNVEKNQFIGMAAHDLRNPLSVIIGYAEYLLEDPASINSQDSLEVVATIKTASAFMLRMVDELLSLSHLESSQLELHREDLDLAAFLAGNIAVNQRLAAVKDITIALACDPLPPIGLDRPKIQQVFDNLITNAIKYSHPGTQIRIRGTYDGAHGQVNVAVVDQGQGIPAGELANLFKPFQTTSVKATAGETSTGLGLAIVKRIVEGHGGRIGVESEIGVGTTFRVELPAPPGWQPAT